MRITVQYNKYNFTAPAGISALCVQTLSLIHILDVYKRQGDGKSGKTQKQIPENRGRPEGEPEAYGIIKGRV